MLRCMSLEMGPKQRLKNACNFAALRGQADFRSRRQRRAGWARRAGRIPGRGAGRTSSAPGLRRRPPMEQRDMGGKEVALRQEMRPAKVVQPGEGLWIELRRENVIHGASDRQVKPGSRPSAAVVCGEATICRADAPISAAASAPAAGRPPAALISRFSFAGVQARRLDVVEPG